MTCIVGIAKEGKVYIGGDSFVSSNGRHRRTAIKKVFTIGEFLIGYTTSTRMGNLLRFSLQVEKQKHNDDFQYMVTKFIPAIRELFEEGGYSQIDNNVERGGNFLVGYRGILYEIDSDFQVESYINGFAIVGSGEAVALGAVQAIIHVGGIDPIETIEIALDVAGIFTNTVGSPYYIEVL